MIIMNRTPKLTDYIKSDFVWKIEFICNWETFGYYDYKGGEEKYYQVLFKVIQEISKDFDYSPFLQFVKRIEELQEDERIEQAVEQIFNDFSIILW